MTCNECVHCEACKRILKTAFLSVTAEEIEKASSRDNNCTLFKNKADVVEVVRCKDCKNAYINSFSAQNGIAVCRSFANSIVQQDGFCSYGEREEK